MVSCGLGARGRWNIDHQRDEASSGAVPPATESSSTPLEPSDPSWPASEARVELFRENLRARCSAAVFLVLGDMHEASRGDATTIISREAEVAPSRHDVALPPSPGEATSGVLVIEDSGGRNPSDGLPSGFSVARSPSPPTLRDGRGGQLLLLRKHLRWA